MLTATRSKAPATCDRTRHKNQQFAGCEHMLVNAEIVKKNASNLSIPKTVPLLVFV